MRFTSFFTSALISLLILALAIMLGARAGEGDAPPPPQEDTFTFEAHDRRDPFTFTKTVPKGGDTVSVQPGEVDHNPNRLDAAQIAAKRAVLQQYANAAAQNVMDYHYAIAAADCDRGLDELKDIRVNEYKELQAGRDELIRLHKAAQRGKTREDVERDFSIINLHLTGVLVSQRMPRAIVNGHVAAVGDTITTADDGAVIFSIETDRVTFIYRNFRIGLGLEK